MLGAMLTFADSGQVVLTGQLSAQTQQWLTDHRVLGSVVLPGTGLVELASQAGLQVGCELVEELTLQALLVLPEDGTARLQIQLGAPGENGEREITISSRAHEAGRTDLPWVLHAAGVVAPRAAAPSFELSQWPPPGASPIDVHDAYPYLLSRGYEYGPVFRGLRAAWRAGDDLFAEVSLPDQSRASAQRYGLHPALLDAALHLLSIVDGEPDGERTMLPFSWAGMTIHATGASMLRVRMTVPRRNVVSMEIADMSGAPLCTVEELSFRPVTPAQLSRRQAHAARVTVPGGLDDRPDGRGRRAERGELGGPAGWRRGPRRRGT